ncbi:MAG: nucleotidyltransferase family protein [Saprospiraceae bacterium]
MKAMVFAAGLGTRLRPYTNDRPKALVELAGQSLLEITLTRLRHAGVEEVVVNVHHFADQVREHLQKNDDFGLRIHISDETDLLLDTGGGLARARRWLGDAPFLVHNVDIVHDIDLWAMYRYHLNHPALATLSARHRETSRYLEFDDALQLCGWVNTRTGDRKISRNVPATQRLAYSGIAVIDPELFTHFPVGVNVFSIIDVWLEAARRHRVQAMLHDTATWFDVGKPATLEAAAAWMKS